MEGNFEFYDKFFLVSNVWNTSYPPAVLLAAFTLSAIYPRRKLFCIDLEYGSVIGLMIIKSCDHSLIAVCLIGCRHYFHSITLHFLLNIYLQFFLLGCHGTCARLTLLIMHRRWSLRPSPRPLRLLRRPLAWLPTLTLVISAAQLTVSPYLVHSNETLHHEVFLQVDLLLHELLDFAQVLLHVLHFDASIHCACCGVLLVIMALQTTEGRCTAPTTLCVVGVHVHTA